jgi:hypothetical protein
MDIELFQKFCGFHEKTRSSKDVDGKDKVKLRPMKEFNLAFKTGCNIK